MPTLDQAAEFVGTYLPWLLSSITVWQTLLAGNKAKHAWIVGLVNQTLWLTWILATRNWGFLPLNLVLTAVYVRNHLRWQPERSPWWYAQSCVLAYASEQGKPHVLTVEFDSPERALRAGNVVWQEQDPDSPG